MQQVHRSVLVAFESIASLPVAIVLFGHGPTDGAAPFVVQV
jgi:hypothetical protein